jgi:hypothetical protein
MSAGEKSKMDAKFTSHKVLDVSGLFLEENINNAFHHLAFMKPTLCRTVIGRDVKITFVQNKSIRLTVSLSYFPILNISFRYRNKATHMVLDPE